MPSSPGIQLINQQKNPNAYPLFMEKMNNCTCFNNPQITGFFQDYDLDECGSLLWQLLKLSTVANRTEILSANEWFNLLSFYESLDELLKTLYMNYTKQQS